MKLLCCLLLLASSAYCELIIAVPSSSLPQQQTFEASFINKAPVSVPVQAATVPIQTIQAPVQGVPVQQYQAVPAAPTITSRQDAMDYFQNPNIEIHEFQDPTPAIDSRSFSMLKHAAAASGETLGIGRTDKGGLTITIKLDGHQVAGLQGQGSNPKSAYAQAPRSTSNYIQQSNSLADVLNGGIQLVNPFKTTAPPPSPSKLQVQPQHYQDTITELPLTESNSFLKSMTNLIKSQISSMMDSKSLSQSSFSQGKYSQPTGQSDQQLPYQSFAIFTPISTQPPKQPQNFRQNVGDFLTQKFPGLNSNKPNSNLQIAIPQNNHLQQGGFAYAPTESPYDDESPIRSAASTILKSVSNIPTNLDAMFLDMGRVYRQNLFSLRDKLSDMKSLVPGMMSSPVNKDKEVTEPWLDGFGV